MKELAKKIIAIATKPDTTPKKDEKLIYHYTP